MRLRTAAAAFGAGLLSVLFLGGMADAVSASISNAYKSDRVINPGSLVSLTSEQSGFVEPAHTENGSRLLGVVVGENNSLLSIDPLDEGLQVATSGTVPALVSDVNGPVRAGDEISVSPFSGIGMRAGPKHQLIGLAQSTLDGNTARTVKREVADDSGKRRTINVGYVQVAIAIGPSSAGEGRDPLQRLVSDLAGKDVSKARAIASSIIGIIGAIALLALIFSSIYGSIIAIGRNPLAKKQIYRTLVTVSAMALATSIVVIFTIYMLLR